MERCKAEWSCKLPFFPRLTHNVTVISPVLYCQSERAIYSPAAPDRLGMAAQTLMHLTWTKIISSPRLLQSKRTGNVFSVVTLPLICLCYIFSLTFPGVCPFCSPPPSQFILSFVSYCKCLFTPAAMRYILLYCFFCFFCSPALLCMHVYVTPAPSVYISILIVA